MFEDVIDELETTLIELGFVARFHKLELWHKIGETLAGLDDLEFINNLSMLSKTLKVQKSDLLCARNFFNDDPPMTLKNWGKDVSWEGIKKSYKIYTRKRVSQKDIINKIEQIKAETGCVQVEEIKEFILRGKDEQDKVR